jgi:putative ATPase
MNTGLRWPHDEAGRCESQGKVDAGEATLLRKHPTLGQEVYEPMPRQETGSLFGGVDDGWSLDLSGPLADRMRPRTLAEFEGQEHLVGVDRPLRRVLAEGGTVPSLILWGAPGTGKTTLARLLAAETGAHLVALSAVLAGVKEVREVIAQARRDRRQGERTVLFIDEIHRFNKAQQDALLPAVEDGTVSLIGATTENPSFEVISALLSRCRVLTLQGLSEEEIGRILRRALGDAERGLAEKAPIVSAELVGQLARSSAGDARVALSALESAVLATEPDTNGRRVVSREAVVEALGRARFAYDKGGEDHYNLASALIKSLRNSNVTAALYWLARMIEGGADPMFIVRRLCILASEDIGLADPQAMVQAAAAAQITHLIGFPEALFPLSQATIYLATAPKSNAVLKAYGAAAADAAETSREPVPLHLRNAVTPLMKAGGYGQGYRYIHEDPAAATEMPCLPEALADRVYYEPPRPPPALDSDQKEGRTSPEEDGER